MEHEPIAMEPIGWVESVFKEKFGAPRQSGVVPSAHGVIHFYPPYDQAAAFEELQGFSHLWIISQFHLVPAAQEFRPRVRPPKLGGAKKVGVFASRAPFRPNRLCLSVVKIEKVREEAGRVLLEISGLDLVHGTPVLDIKPYLPYADAIPEASTSFGLPPDHGHDVVPATTTTFEGLSESQIQLITETLQAHPQPAYAKSDQEFGLTLGEMNIRWYAKNGQIVVISVTGSDF